MVDKPKSSTWLKVIVPVLLLGSSALLATWPLAAQISTHLPARADTLEHYWNGWWVLQALKDGRLPYETELLFYPQGLRLVYHNFALLHIAVWIILQAVLSGIVAYNITFVLLLTLVGLSAYWLALELTHDHRVALLAGLIYQLWPYRMAQPDHPNLMSTWAIPLFMLFLIRLLRRRRWLDAVAAGLMLALVGYNRWQMLIPAVIAAALFLLATTIVTRQLPPLRQLLAAGLITLLLLLPPILLLAGEMSANPADLTLEDEALSMQTDMLAYLTPPDTHPLVGSVTQPLYEKYYAGRGDRGGFSPFVGFTVLALAIFGFWRADRRRLWPWLAVAAGIMLLALGPILRFNGQEYPQAPLPYTFVDRLVPISLLREPERFNMFLALPLTVLAAYGLKALLDAEFFRTRPMKTWLMALLVGLVFLEFLVLPLPVQSAATSNYYEELAQDAAASAILNIPLNPFLSKPYMFAQTAHHKPILQGHSSRYPADAFHFLEGQSWLNEVMQFSKLTPRHRDIGRQLADLNASGISHIVLHKNLLEETQLAHWRVYLAQPALFEDADIIVYATAVDLASSPKVAPDLSVVASYLSAGCLAPGDVLTAEIAWGSSSTTIDSHEFVIELIDDEATAHSLATLSYPLAGDTDYLGSAINWESYPLSIPAGIAAGDYEVQLSARAASAGANHFAPRVLGHITVPSVASCPAAIPAASVPLAAQFDDSLALLAYRLDHSGRDLTLTLYWSAAQRLQTDYKVFVHIFDPATGVPVAQDDAMPQRWRYPTSYWWPGEVIEDAIPISLEAVPAGQYGIAVGIYHPQSGERLGVRNAAGQPQAESRLVLPDTLTID